MAAPPLLHHDHAVTLGDQSYFDKSFKVAGAKQVEFRFLYGDAKSRDARPVKP